MYDARSVANWFIERGKQAGEPFGLVELVYLAFLSHGWNLALYRKPLFDNKIEAWPSGPMVLDVYHTFRKQGYNPGKPSPKHPTVSDGESLNLLQQVYDIYAKMSVWTLRNLLRPKGGPWETAIKWGGSFAEIPDDLIKAHYLVQLVEHREKNGQ